jgi:hypothetical protein
MAVASTVREEGKGNARFLAGNPSSAVGVGAAGGTTRIADARNPAGVRQVC